MSSIIDLSSAQSFVDGPRLLADIGGTNARFALEYAPGRIESIQVLPAADYREFVDAFEAYRTASGVPTLRHAAVAIANPVRGDFIKMTNHHWSFSIDETRRQLNLDTLLVVNDFTALAMALPYLQASDYYQLGSGQILLDGVRGLVGAGTGLGVGGLIPHNGQWVPLSSEGGHVTFSPSDEREVEILRYCWKTYKHVSAERLVSGLGIALIYEALAAQYAKSHAVEKLETPVIVERGLSGSDLLCSDVLNCFCAMLGTVASNVAVTLGTLGGLYVGGGIVPRLGQYFAQSPFRARFEGKGRFGDYLKQIPTLVITAPYPAFVGVAAILDAHLKMAKT
jgi:glucokinase